VLLGFVPRQWALGPTYSSSFSNSAHYIYNGERAIAKTAFMSRQDLFHEAVKQGLIKKQWIISHDPLELK